MIRKMQTLAMLLIAMGVAAASWASVPVADAAEVKQLLDNEPDFTLVLDVRTPGEWSRGHISGSMLIPMRQVPQSLARIPKTKKIVVVCATGARSGAVAKFLQDQGYIWVKNYAGGLVDWSRRGYPLVR